MYYLAQQLDQRGETVFIYPAFGAIANPLYNRYYDKEGGTDPAPQDCIVIYCEGTQGNPLKSPYSVRWMLSRLGTNVPKEFADTWDKNELVYHFGWEAGFTDDWKLLPLVYMNPKIEKGIQEQDRDRDRDLVCSYQFRKFHVYHKSLRILHPVGAHEITRETTMEEAVAILCRSKLFISYDPASFYATIATLCGCVALVYPTRGVSKQEWFQTSAFYPFLGDDEGFFGIAYGESELEWAHATLSRAQEQMDRFLARVSCDFLPQFVRDVTQRDRSSLRNTVANVFFNPTTTTRPSMLITGGRGNLAQIIVRHLEATYTILAPSHSELDLTQPLQVDHFLQGRKFDVLVHTAILGGRRTKEETSAVTHTNLLMFENLMRHQEKFGRILNLDSAAIYDRATNIMNRSEKDGLLATVPQDFYGFSKYLIFQRSLSLAHMKHLRIFNVFHDNEEPDRFIRTLRDQGEVTIEEDKYFDFFSDTDFARVVQYFSAAPLESLPKAVNICYQSKLKLSEIAALFCPTTKVTVVREAVNHYCGDSSLLYSLEVGQHICKTLQDSLIQKKYIGQE